MHGNVARLGSPGNLSGHQGARDGPQGPGNEVKSRGGDNHQYVSLGGGPRQAREFDQTTLHQGCLGQHVGKDNGQPDLHGERQQ